MKKYLFLSLLAILLLLSGCTEKTQSIEEIYNDAKIENVDKIIIHYGATGYKKTITNQEQITEFLSLINNIEFTRIDKAEEWGALYYIYLFDGKREFIFNMNQIGKRYYDSNPAIEPIIDNYYQQLDIEEEV